MNNEELKKLLIQEVKRSGILVNQKNLSELFKNKSLKQLNNLISGLMEASPPFDDVMRLDSIIIIQEIIKERKRVLKGEVE